MPILQAAQDVASLILDITAPTIGSGFVPTTRNINTTAPLGGGGPLSSDLTLTLTTSPAGQTPVGVTRLINTTAPLAGGGNLSADLTLTVATFGAANSGVVPASGGGTVNFLRADGSWVAGTVVGVAQATGTLPITVSPITGNVVIGVNVFSSVTSGIVPASGGGTVNYLRADGTWSPLGAGLFVTLQGGTPGTVDTGNFDITGTGICQTNLMVGGTTTPFNNFVILATSNAGGKPLYAGQYWSGDASGGTYSLYKARGTQGAPAATQNNDSLGAFTAAGYNSTNLFFGNPTTGLFFWADGNALSTTQPTYSDWFCGALAAPGFARLSQAGLRVQANGFQPLSTDRALSTLDVNGSFGATTVGKTATFTADANTFSYKCDATTGQIIANIPAASACANRIYGFMKTDSGPNSIRITPAGGNINGQPVWEMFGFGESVLVQSDGTNYWLVASDASILNNIYSRQIADTVANTAVLTAFATALPFSSNRTYVQGGSFRMRWNGQLSCTGTPTITFEVHSNALAFGSTTPITLPTGLTNRNWSVDFMSSLHNYGGGMFLYPHYHNIYLPNQNAFPTQALTYQPDGTMAPVAFNSSASFQLFVKWGTASASNTVSVSTAHMDYVPPGPNA